MRLISLKLRVENSELTDDQRPPQVAFKVYDMDRDGFISNGELFLVLKMMVGSNLKVRFLARNWLFLFGAGK